MFSQRRVVEKLTAISEKTGWVPEYHTLSEIEAFNSHFDALADKAERDEGDRRYVQERLGYEELKWIDNEFRICASDYRYWTENYAYINANGQIERFKRRASQEMLLELWAERQELGYGIEQQILKARQQGCCLHPDTLILTSALRWITLGDVEVGEEIIAVDENHPGGRGADRKMRTAIVEKKFEIVETAVKITLDNGDVLVATPRHRFLSKQYESMSQTEWKRVRDMGIGTSIRYITDQWGDSSYEDGWFGGIMDGEGHMASARESGASIQVHQKYGLVWDRIRRYLDSHGYTYSVFEDSRTATPNGKLGKEPVGCVEVSRMDQLFRLFGTTRPERYGRRWWEGKSLPGKRSGVGWRKIVSLEILPCQRMIDLQTSTGTYIANGYVSHNSTEVELAICHQVNFGMGVNAAIASYDSDACERMFGMAQLAFNEQPMWMKANPTSDRAGSFLAFAGNSTRLTQYSGRKASGIARGDTPSVIHISEVSSFPRAKDIIENSLFQSVHPSPRIFMILESTGNGNTDWWATTWYSSRDYWASGGARLQPVFFPWFIADDLFPGETWRREHPVPGGWHPIIETERMMDKCAAYVHNTPLMRRFYGDDWRMPPYQAYFWELNYLEYKRKGNARGWAQEMSCDDIEALQPKKDLVFDVAETEKQYRERDGYTVWAITGEQIPERYHPESREIDYNTDRFRVAFNGQIQDVTGKHSHEMVWEFVPLKQPEEKAGSIFDADCKLIVFKWPEPGYDYGVGVDPSGGTGGDNAVICVMRRSQDGREPDEQVAEFASNKIPQAMLHPFIMAIATLYAQEMSDVPLVAIENVYGTGDTAQIQMLEHGYKRHYKFSRLDGKNPKKDQKKSKKLGWYSFDWSRTFMLGQYVNAVQNGWYKLHSPFLLRNEIPAFQIDQTEKGKIRMDHESGKHDDRIFASAIAYIIFNDTESMSKRVEHKFVGETVDVKVNYDWPEGMVVPYTQVFDGFEAAI